MPYIQDSCNSIGVGTVTTLYIKKGSSNTSVGVVEQGDALYSNLALTAPVENKTFGITQGGVDYTVTTVAGGVVLVKSPCIEVSTTPTASPSATPGSSLTPTPTVTPSVTSTPGSSPTTTPTITVTPSITPTISLSNTPPNSITPTPTPSPSVVVNFTTTGNFGITSGAIVEYQVTWAMNGYKTLVQNIGPTSACFSGCTYTANVAGVGPGDGTGTITVQRTAPDGTVDDFTELTLSVVSGGTSIIGTNPRLYTAGQTANYDWNVTGWSATDQLSLTINEG